jgi:D-sedoheptulose 7-phosphate isomerase
MTNDIKAIIAEHARDIDLLLKDDNLLNQIEDAIALLCHSFLLDQKALFCGNGGSAADAEHLSGELSGKFKMDRPPLYAEALHVNGAALTAVANDFNYEETFSRLLQAKGKENDVLIALSTSGSSSNIINAMKKAGKLSMKVIGMSGNFDTEFANLCDIHIKINSKNTPRIQEAMMLIGHIICEKVESNLFG